MFLVSSWLQISGWSIILMDRAIWTFCCHFLPFNLPHELLIFMPLVGRSWSSIARSGAPLTSLFLEREIYTVALTNERNIFNSFALLSNPFLSNFPLKLFYRSFVHLGAGLSVGFCGLAAGLAIGMVGDAGVRGTAQQPRLFVGMILVLIFAEVLGLYGLIVALILSTKNG